MSEYRPVAKRSTLFMYLMLACSAALLVYLFSGTSAPVIKAAKVAASATCGSCSAGGAQRLCHLSDTYAGMWRCLNHTTPHQACDTPCVAN